MRETVYWDAVAARLLSRLLKGRTRGPVFLADGGPPPPNGAAADVCPSTGRGRLSCPRAETLFKTSTADLDPHDDGWTLHQLCHSAATHLGAAEVPLQLIIGKTRHKNPRTAMRYVKPGAEAISPRSPRSWRPAAVPTDPRWKSHLTDPEPSSAR